MAGMPGLEPGNAGVKVRICRVYGVFLSAVEYLVKPLIPQVKSAFSDKKPQIPEFMRINLRNNFYQSLLANVRLFCMKP